ncbi:hypothetical protein ABMA27_012417 [Loxostege sticticalis]|uniref:C2H2-type domain-containing protein n=1 Tax=Loxostege sticticalis TaxID=481309 RepID=A0ABR3H182_LOXSC
MKMANMQVCRVCLAHDMPMCSINNTMLQEFYEKNTNKPFNTLDGRLSMVCYICYHLLKKCHRFFESAVKANEVLQEMYDSKTQITEKSFAKMDNKFLIASFKQTPVAHTAVGVFRDFDIEIQLEQLGEHKEHPGVKRELPDVEGTDQEYDAMDDFLEEPIQDDFGIAKEIEINIKGTEKGHIIIEPLGSKKAEATSKQEKREERGGSKEFREVILSKEEQIQQLLERTKTSKYQHLLYKCNFCYKGFVDDDAFRDHMRKHDESSGEFECDVCHNRYPTARQLHQHSSMYHRKYVCTVCEHTSRTIAQAKLHFKWQHRPSNETKEIEPEFICNRCGNQFKELSLLMQHLKTHGNVPPQVYDEVPVQTTKSERFEVQIETAEYRRREELEQIGDPAPTDTYLENTRKRYSREVNYVCNYCGANISDITVLQTHIKTVHIDKKQMDYIGDNLIKNKQNKKSDFAHLKTLDRVNKLQKRKEMNTKNNTVSLMIRKERKRYVCNRCGKIVDNKSDLIAHFTKHTHKKTYVCHFCGKSCKSKPALKEHVRIHTGEKPFECDYCNKKFTQKSTVVKHLRMHTGEKPYTCDYCGVKISQLSNLRMHLKRHTGEKPFTCSYCQKSFPRKNHLTEHLRLHTGETPFACVYCDKKFQQKRYLNRHVKAHSETKKY